jgi:hypothetical protein
MARRPIREENINFDTMIKRQGALELRSAMGYRVEKKDGTKTQSMFYDPLTLESNAYGTIRTISPYYGRVINHKVLRRVSEKAWILNLCIQNITKKIRPYLKPVSSENQRGFRVKKRDTEKMSDSEKKTAKAMEDFLLKTGDVRDDNREDDIDKYVTKIVRDLCQLDQIATELQYTKGGDLCAFWAIDAGTIEVALPATENETGIKYVQVIDHIPYAPYSRDELIFDCMNPRTDIERAGYGYSIVEQAIDLVTSSINTFMFNAGFFQENKLPRGILLLQGDADQKEVDDIEDYIVNLMSGPPTSQWRIPIIPSGRPDGAGGGESRKIEFVSLQGTNREMEFQSWYDLQLSGIVGLFGLSMEDLGIHSSKSQPLIGLNNTPLVETSKSIVLGDILGFLQKHFNQILSHKKPDYEVEILGYERADPKLSTEIDKQEVEAWKTLNEKREEKGFEPIDLVKINNPADLPMNIQVVQLWQSTQQGAGSPFGGDMGDDEGDEGSDFDEGDLGDSDEDGTEKTSEGDNDTPYNSGWDEIDRQHGREKTEKSLNKSGIVKIII